MNWIYLFDISWWFIYLYVIWKSDLTEAEDMEIYIRISSYSSALHVVFMT